MQTRKPTGRAPWPMVLIAGAEKAGKSWAAAEATGHDLIRNAYWLGIGEDDPDEYAQVPGADFSIIEHDGTYGAVLAALRDVVGIEQDPANPDLLIVDSMGRLWAQLSDMAQAEANQRAAAKAAKYHRAAPDEDVQIGMDLWNRAKGRWAAVLDLLREYPGPVIVTARLSVVSVMDAEGKPTKEKVDKVEAEKNLVYDVGAVVKMHARGQALLDGVRSAKLQLDRPTPLRDFSLANLWEAMGVGADMEPRRHAGQPTVTPEEQEAEAEAEAPQWLDLVQQAQDVEACRGLWKQARDTGAMTDGLAAAINQRVADLQAAQQPPLEGDVVPSEAGAA
ncbi:MAG: hypothetical protein L0G94_14085 [Brachybacterium sp.]|uniref:hypothetical protein n=1 Tax=Brachybacterium sp. TaxID=1891286 RepID=UPI002647323F|nr:hypothetical protein [Brachybacterium sp.]MDN5687782.1 hypothetical protein [Brachybacterium sp.]